ncbi:uncharacterized protein [Procambarus clarkii]|uniref:uncharacterized protein isoform X2 n=1 Tax=Procambarus clarkii TaxID=6728 RepID=UPI00374307B0
MTRRCGMSKAVFSTLSVMVLWVIYLLLGSAVFIYLEETHLTVSVVGDHQHWSRFKELVSAGAVVEELFTLRDNLLNLCPHTIFNNSFSQMENGPVIIELRNATTRSPLFSGLQKLELDGDWREQVEKECTDSLRIIHEVTETNSWSMADARLLHHDNYHVHRLRPHRPNDKGWETVLRGLHSCWCPCNLHPSNQLRGYALQLHISALYHRQETSPTAPEGTAAWHHFDGHMRGLDLLTLLPSVVLSKLEDWSYEDALYFTFNTNHNHRFRGFDCW